MPAPVPRHWADLSNPYDCCHLRATVRQALKTPDAFLRWCHRHHCRMRLSTILTYLTEVTGENWVVTPMGLTLPGAAVDPIAFEPSWLGSPLPQEASMPSPECDALTMLSRLTPVQCRTLLALNDAAACGTIPTLHGPEAATLGGLARLGLQQGWRLTDEGRAVVGLVLLLRVLAEAS